MLLNNHNSILDRIKKKIIFEMQYQILKKNALTYYRAKL